MEWQQLEYFHTVARLQHMTLAAQTLCITQPALSRSIARLEKELGVPLFERNGRAIVLNRYGRLFLNRVNRIMNEYQEGKRELEDLIHPEHGEVSLGFLHTLGVHSIPDVIRSFRSAYPQIHFQLHQNSTQFLLDQLSAGGSTSVWPPRKKRSTCNGPRYGMKSCLLSFLKITRLPLPNPSCWRTYGASH